MNRQKWGQDMEEVAAQYLESVRGWKVLARRVRFREGELDLVMETGRAEGGELRFVEVKARRNEKYGGVVEAVTTHKLLRLRRAVYRWRERFCDARKGSLYFLGILLTDDERLTIEEHFLE